LQEETTRISLELDALREKTKENQEKIKLNKQLPYLVGNVVEVCSIQSQWFFYC
jgi:26S proteasome regulatory subunit T5